MLEDKKEPGQCKFPTPFIELSFQSSLLLTAYR